MRVGAEHHRDPSQDLSLLGTEELDKARRDRERGKEGKSVYIGAGAVVVILLIVLLILLL